MVTREATTAITGVLRTTGATTQGARITAIDITSITGIITTVTKEVA